MMIARRFLLWEIILSVNIIDSLLLQMAGFGRITWNCFINKMFACIWNTVYSEKPLYDVIAVKILSLWRLSRFYVFPSFKVKQTDKEISNNSQSALKGRVRHGSCKPKGVHACFALSLEGMFFKTARVTHYWYYKMAHY